MPMQVQKKRGIFSKLFTELLRESTIHGMNIFLLSLSPKWAKKLWFVFMVLIFISTHFIIVKLAIAFAQQPTELHMSTNKIHVGNSPFPAIAVCSPNKISRRKLLAYAERVFNVQQSFSPNLLAPNVSALSEHLIALTGFSLHPGSDFEPNNKILEDLHKLFTHMYKSPNYPLRYILFNLAPDCENLVIRARILGSRVNVSDYFVKRMISPGVCCMFNYRRESYVSDESIRCNENAVVRKAASLRIESNSIMNSIEFVIQHDDKDVAFYELSNNAFMLNIFSNKDYGALQSTTIGELFVDQDTIVEIPIQPRMFLSSNDIRSYPPHLRKCYFPEEGRKIINQSFYSIDECLAHCRVENIMKFCGCIASSMTPDVRNRTECNFMDLGCLSRWKALWYGWDSCEYAYTTSELWKSAYEGCGQCLPTCDGVEYDIDVNTLPLRKARGPTYLSGILAGLSNEKPLAIVKVFFLERFAQETIQDVVADHRLGGILSLMFGFSFISYIEILYYLTGKWFSLFWTKTPNHKKRNKARKFIDRNGDKSLATPPYQELYCLTELNPRRVNLKVSRKYRK